MFTPRVKPVPLPSNQDRDAPFFVGRERQESESLHHSPREEAHNEEEEEASCVFQEKQRVCCNQSRSVIECGFGERRGSVVA